MNHRPYNFLKRRVQYVYASIKATNVYIVSCVSFLKIMSHKSRAWRHPIGRNPFFKALDFANHSEEPVDVT